MKNSPKSSKILVNKSIAGGKGGGTKDSLNNSPFLKKQKIKFSDPFKIESKHKT